MFQLQMNVIAMKFKTNLCWTILKIGWFSSSHTHTHTHTHTLNECLYDMVPVWAIKYSISGWIVKIYLQSSFKKYPGLFIKE